MACGLEVEVVRGLAAFFVIAATLGDLLLLAVASEGRGAVKPCLNQKMSPTLSLYSPEGLREDVRLFIILLLPLEVFLAATSAWLLHVAPTRHLQHAAGCMVLCWGVLVTLLTDQILHCGLAARLAGPHTALNAAMRSGNSLCSFGATAALSLMIQTRMERLYAGRIAALGESDDLSHLLDDLLPLRPLDLQAHAWAPPSPAAAAKGLQLGTTASGGRGTVGCQGAAAADDGHCALCLHELPADGVYTRACRPYDAPASEPSLWIWWFGPMGLDTLANAFAALTLSGALTGALGAARAEELQRLQRRQRRARAVAEWRRRQGQAAQGQASQQGQAEREWASKVRELAGRGFSLEALLAFYDTLGGECMPHFDPERHTTADVVRQAIIPRTSKERCALSSQLMDGRETRPQKFITHTWSSRFADLVSAIAADALGEHEFAMVAYLLGHDRKRLERMLTEAGTLSRSYWVCAVSVNQHLGICDTNSQGSCDPVTGLVHPSCDCGLPKALGDTPPTLADGRSTVCEMNKFHDLVALLSAEDPRFEQVIAVDENCVLFSRAWCVSEIATSHASGMEQQLKLMSAENLQEHEHWLRRLAIQDMKASKPEDKVEILKHIPDVEAFNTQLQALLFEDLLPSWQALDASEQMLRAGRIVRWQVAATARGSVGVWSAGSKTRHSTEGGVAL